MKLEDLLWSKRQWELIRNGGHWAVPFACLVMERNPKGFSVHSIMPFDVIRQAAGTADVPKTADDLLELQRSGFRLMQEHFETAGLTFDDPKHLLGL